MKLQQILSALSVLATLALSPVVTAQDKPNEQNPPEVDGSELDRQLIERLAKLGKLSHEEQAAVREARINADRDPAVQAALAKRNQALQEFQAILAASMIKADPELAPILAKMAGLPGH
ncbi:MAG: hypothetical protein ABIZ56_13260 [Chthoniobacteraceae bacterium]